MTGLLLFGAEGRMGREVAALAEQYGFTLGEKAEAAIDFSHPDALDAVLDAVLARGIPLVSGTTGYSLAQQQQIHAAAQRVPILRSANFSLGAAVMARLLAQAASSLPGWDGALIERHHAGKRDMPSGTAIALAQAMADASGYAVEDVPAESANAGFKDWFLQRFRRPAFTIECGAGENPLPPEQEDAVFREVLPLLTACLEP